MQFNCMNDSRIFILSICILTADYSRPDILECKIFDPMDLEEALDFRLDVHTKCTQNDNFIAELHAREASAGGAP